MEGQARSGRRPPGPLAPRLRRGLAGRGGGGLRFLSQQVERDVLRGRQRRLPEAGRNEESDSPALR